MDSAAFYALTKNFAHLTTGEANSLEQLAKQHPYCQIIHLLHSRAAQDLGYPNKSELLNISAVYSSDRNVLKWVMTTARTTRVEEPLPVATREPSQEPAPVVIAVASAPMVNPPIAKPADNLAIVSLSDDALRDDIYVQLQKLKKSKHDFEVSLEEFQKTSLAEGLEVESKKKNKTVKEGMDPLLDEIKSSKKKLKVDNPKQIEQNEIIDQFIKTQPIIPKAKPTTPANDLSEESSVFSDGIVSETLVDILLKQGKKEKAIEVLKKLIWKFPQKKAYFAAQIEELKN